MVSEFFKTLRLVLAIAVIGTTMLIGPAPAQAQQQLTGERYEPGIWVDPDGCEHWVMDDGAEGYMTPHVTRDGIPVCRRGNTCAVFEGDQLFATGKSTLSAAARSGLETFFRTEGAIAYMIAGHTDSRGSDAANMRLSLQRANAVAAIARSVGARVGSINGYGERVPKASNTTAAGMQLNRRVEIMCLR